MSHKRKIDYEQLVIDIAKECDNERLKIHNSKGFSSNGRKCIAYTRRIKNIMYTIDISYKELTKLKDIRNDVIEYLFRSILKERKDKIASMNLPEVLESHLLLYLSVKHKKSINLIKENNLNNI